MDIVLIVVAVVLAAILVFTVMRLIGERTQAASAGAMAESLRRQVEERDKRLDESLREQTRLAAENSRLLAENRALETRAAEMQAQMHDRFRVLASEVMNANSTLFRDLSAEKLGDILTPFRNELDEFRKTVRDSHEQETADLRTLREAVGDLRQSNDKVSATAGDLARVLRGDTRAQGKWGEVILEHVLEKSGLDPDVYTIQATRADDGKALRNEDCDSLRPDVIIRYPGKRYTVIDAKMSLTAFSTMSVTDDPETRCAAAAEHLRSVNRHIEKLSRKDYSACVADDSEPLGFVIMFIPVEAAYIAALRLDNQLWEKAYARNVVLVSTSQLIPLLRLIERTWSREKITKNSLDIVRRGNLMLEKFRLMVEAVEKTENAMAEASRQLATVRSRLTEGDGNLISQAEKLRKLGVTAQKQLSRKMLDEAEESD